jgi:hypothetical protein
MSHGSPRPEIVAQWRYVPYSQRTFRPIANSKRTPAWSQRQPYNKPQGYWPRCRGKNCGFHACIPGLGAKAQGCSPVVGLLVLGQDLSGNRDSTTNKHLHLILGLLSCHDWLLLQVIASACNFPRRDPRRDPAKLLKHQTYFRLSNDRPSIVCSNPVTKSWEEQRIRSLSSVRMSLCFNVSLGCHNFFLQGSLLSSFSLNFCYPYIHSLPRVHIVFVIIPLIILAIEPQLLMMMNKHGYQ